jgi:hypothetical protein
MICMLMMMMMIMNNVWRIFKISRCFQIISLILVIISKGRIILLMGRNC